MTLNVPGPSQWQSWYGRTLKAQKPLLHHCAHAMCDSRTSCYGRIGSSTVTANDIIFHKTNFSLPFRDLQTALDSSCNWRRSLAVLFSNALKHLHLHQCSPRCSGHCWEVAVLAVVQLCTQQRDTPGAQCCAGGALLVLGAPPGAVGAWAAARARLSFPQQLAELYGADDTSKATEIILPGLNLFIPFPTKPFLITIIETSSNGIASIKA